MLFAEQVSQLEIRRCCLKNIEAKVQDDKLVITIDLTKDFGLSGSGKSIIIASTEGNVPVPGREEIKIGVNVYRTNGSR